jgi:hypothetical protein
MAKGLSRKIAVSPEKMSPAKAQRRKENPLETRQRFAPLREKSSRKKYFSCKASSRLLINCRPLTSIHKISHPPLGKFDLFPDTLQN